MGLLSRDRNPGEAVAVLPTPVQPPAEPALLLTPDGWLVGHLVDTPGRVSDALARRDTVGLMTDRGYREVDATELLLVVPPPCPPNPGLRVARRQVPVSIDIADGMNVRGLCHVRPGGTLWDTWQRSASGFAALTDAVVTFADGTAETADVILVSRHVAGSGLRVE